MPLTTEIRLASYWTMMTKIHSLISQQEPFLTSKKVVALFEVIKSFEIFSLEKWVFSTSVNFSRKIEKLCVLANVISPVKHNYYNKSIRWTINKRLYTNRKSAWHLSMWSYFERNSAKKNAQILVFSRFYGSFVQNSFSYRS